MVRTIKITSSIHNINEIEFFLNSIFRESNFSRKIYCKIYLAVIESVTNAITHGNQLNKDKFVTISFEEKEAFIIVSIDDEGDGFNWNIIPNPLEALNIKKETGRGIFIMKEYSDELHFNKRGNSVQLKFNK